MSARRNALDRLESVVACTSKDMSIEFADAMLYAIVFGWDDGDENAWPEIGRLHNLTARDEMALRFLRSAFEAAAADLADQEASDEQIREAIRDRRAP